MPPATTDSGYSRLQVGLHWGIVILVIANWLLAGGMRQMPGQAAPTGVPPHVIVGVTIFALTLFRLLLRFLRPVAAAPQRHAAMHWASVAVHVALYGLLIALPMTGLVAWTLGVRDAGDVHEVLWSVLLGVAFLHVAAALFHQFVLRDNLMRRMAWRS